MLLRVGVFYVLAFLFTALLGGVQQAAGLSPGAAILAQWGPGLAALAMLLIFRRDRLTVTLAGRGVPASRYLAAALIPLAGGALVLLVYRLLAGPAGSTEAVPWSLLLWLPVGAVGEELGWRGYLHKRLDPRLAGLASSALVGVLWALWHVGMYVNGPRYMAFFVLQMIAYSVLIYALAAPHGFPVLLAAAFHLGINVASLVAYPAVNRTDYMMISSLVWAAIAAAVAFLRRTAFAGGDLVLRPSGGSR
jgi:membrane protease YdiL (CAAX protease family)